VSLTEFAIDMPTSLPAGPVVFTISNDGAAPHNFVVEGDGFEGRLPARVAPGASATLELDLPPGTYTVYCPVGAGGHRAQGMELTLTVT
jgi:plastocyanin